MKFELSWKARASLLFLLLSLIYLIAPIDVLPFTIYEDIALIVIAVAFWFFIVIIENKDVEVKEHGSN